ncbi:MAG: YaiO family outer membrane beta-barrel protein, partial [Gemmatimonadales bacterium]
SVTLAVILVALPAQDTAAWRAGLSYVHERFTRDRASWNTLTAAATRKVRLHTFGAQVGTVERFDQTDGQLTAEAYLRLAPRTYAHVQGAVAPGADVIASSDLSAEVFRGVRGGWELSAGYRRMSFPIDAVDILSASVAAYRGWWYLRARAIAVPTAGSTGFSGGLTARRYFGRADRFAEVQGGGGKEVVLVGVGPMVELRSLGFVSARGEALLDRRWGVSGGLSWNAEEGIPSRYGLTVGLFTVW